LRLRLQKSFIHPSIAKTRPNQILMYYIAAVEEEEEEEEEEKE